MAGLLTIEQMRQMIEQLDEAKALDAKENIPGSYIDRLEKASQLLAEYRKLPAIDWSAIKTVEEIEKAEAILHQRSELKLDIERHLSTCGLTVSSAPRGRGQKGLPSGRVRGKRRTGEQMEYARKMAEIQKMKKEELGLPARGRITEDDQTRLEAAIEKEIKKQKLVAPKA